MRVIVCRVMCLTCGGMKIFIKVNIRLEVRKFHEKYLEKLSNSSLEFFIFMSKVEGDIAINRPRPSIVRPIIIVCTDGVKAVFG